MFRRCKINRNSGINYVQLQSIFRLLVDSSKCVSKCMCVYSTNDVRYSPAYVITIILKIGHIVSNQWICCILFILFACIKRKNDLLHTQLIFGTQSRPFRLAANICGSVLVYRNFSLIGFLRHLINMLMQFECDEQVDELCFIHFHQNPHAYNVRLLIAFAFDYLSHTLSHSIALPV